MAPGSAKAAGSDPDRRRGSRTRRAIAATVCLAVGLVVLWVARPDSDVDMLRLQFAGTGEEAGAVVADATAGPHTAEVVGDLVGDARRALGHDTRVFVPLFVVVLVAGLAVLLALGNRAHADAGEPVASRSAWRRWQVAAAVAITAVLAAGVLDWIENAALRGGLDAIDDRVRSSGVEALTTAGTGNHFAVASVLAGSKWALVLLALAVLAALALTWVWNGFVPRPPPAGAALPDDVRTRWTPTPGERKVGISCSGGGVRSATFCLGALQVLDERGILEDAAYVTAVSGGGYVAASWAIANGEAEPPAPAPPGAPPRGPAPRPFAPRSPEETWVRLHSSHLVGSSLVLLAGALRLVAGVLFGGLLIWLLMFATARPIGWLLASDPVHPELRAATPLLETAGQPSLAAVEVALVDQDRSTDPPYAVYSFTPSYTCAEFRSWASTTAPDPTLGAAGLVTTGPGLVRVERGQARITVQPTVEAVAVATADGRPNEQVTGEDCDAPPVPISSGDDVVGVTESTDPVFALDGRDATGSTPREVARSIEASLGEETAPTVTHRSGMTGRPSISIVLGDWLTGVILLAAGFVLYLVRVLWRPFQPTPRRFLEVAASMLSATGAVWALVFVVLPWCVQEVPPFLGELLHLGDTGGASGDGATGLDAVLATVGITGLLATALRSFGQLAVKQGKEHLGLVTRIAVGSLVPLAGVLLVLDLLEFATANGPSGKMLGLGIGMGLADLPGWLASDLARWVGVLVLLAALATVDAHSWSLFPFYKRRLSEAYAIRRTEDGEVVGVRYEDGPVLIARPPPTDVTTRWSRWWAEVFPESRATAESERTLRRRSHARFTGGPDDHDVTDAGPLVMCCAANVSDRSVAPPGRRSVSFTVSEEVIGSDELGWMPTSEYFGRLGPRRLSDVTLPSFMAISGAAISPGMGKMSRGPIDSLLALLNVRLGVWLPSPAVVDARGPGDLWRGIPWWGWYLREVFGVFRPSARYLYVSDGGHWENLGLVELFRRGCTEIYCVSAAGDGPESFTTIGEAIALAREQCGVETDVDLAVLRRPSKAPEEVPRPLRRRPRKKGEKPSDAEWASASFVEGTFTYPVDERGEQVSGRLVVIEANLAGDIPWDVQTWAEASAAFPDDPTTDQLFSHRQFESYRALGRSQMRSALGPPGPPPDTWWVVVSR